MGLPAQLIISLVSASAATAVIVQLELARQPLLMGLVIFIAASVTALLPKNRAASGEQGSAVASGDREEGEVKWFNVSKGFGFIRRDNDEEIFVHFRSIIGNNKDRRGLRDGQRVSYRVVDSDKGPQAEDVEALD